MSEPLCLNAAHEYASYGWKCIRIRAQGKLPNVGDAWQDKATDGEDTLTRWFTEQPSANVGVLLGAASGIIDFEGDGPGAEETFRKMFGGDPPITPVYQSSRGKHRIFRFRGDLPGQGRNHFKIGDLEVRTGYGGMAAQSVFPPSIHASGAHYKWLVSPSECPPAEIPDSVQAWLWNFFGEPTSGLDQNTRAKRDWRQIAKGVSEGSRNDDLAAYAGKLLADLADPFDNGAIGRVLELLHAWNERNTPPMPQDEVNRTFDSILTRHRRSVSNATANEQFEKDMPADAPPDWELHIIESDPPRFRLKSPLWAHGKAKDGFVELPIDKYDHADAICKAVLVQAMEHVAALRFKRMWNGPKGKPGLRDQLWPTAERIAALPEERRSVVVAEAVLGCLEAAKVADERQEPDKRGTPKRMADGSVWFQVGNIHEAIGYTLSKIKQPEIVDCIKAAGARNKQARVGDHVRRFKVLDRMGLRALREAASTGEDAVARSAPIPEAINE